MQCYILVDACQSTTACKDDQACVTVSGQYKCEGELTVELVTIMHEDIRCFDSISGLLVIA